MTSDVNVSRLIGIYDADGTLTGELKYVTLHLLGRVECALCDITHGPLRRKRAFDDMRRRLGMPFELLHRDERDAVLAQATDGAIPCVVGETGEGYVIVLDRDELHRCAGDVAVFERALRTALDTGTAFDT